MKVAVNGVELFFDVEGAKVRPDGPWMRDRPTVILLPTGPGMDHSLYKDNVGPALAEDVQVIYLDLRGAGRSDWSSTRALDAGDVDRRPDGVLREARSCCDRCCSAPGSAA